MLESDLSDSERVKAARRFEVVQESIVDQPVGVIQDPAGSSVGLDANGRPKPLSGGGLSGAIYSTFDGLDPIGELAPGHAKLNTGNPRILHTHSPFLTEEVEPIPVLADAYERAISEFIKTKERHKETVLNLCCISAAIYGGPFCTLWDGVLHLDPWITEVSLTIALARHQKKAPESLDGLTFKLFYHPKYLPESLRKRALSVHEELCRE